jgi:hypothetical protein
MKKVFAVGVLALPFAITSFAQTNFAQTDSAQTNLAKTGTVVTWSNLAGVITSPGVSNKVAGIASGTTPWTTSSGSATVTSTGEAAFAVNGLVLDGGNTSGTPGTVTSVKGTLVCNPGADDQAVLDTPPVPLSVQGNAHFAGHLEISMGVACDNPIFLIRVVPKNVWIATGAARAIK